MRNTALQLATQDFYADLARNCSLALTLQTKLGTLNTSERKREWMTSEAREGMRRFLPRLNRLLTGNGYKRNPTHIPVVITALHGQGNNYDKRRTLHYHLAIGNHDRARVEADGFQKALTQHWCATGIGTDDVLIESIYDTNGWTKYIGGEMLDGNFDSIDLETTQIPTHLLGT